MSEIIKFDFKGAAVRTVRKGTEILWIAADVCEALEILHHRDALARLDDDERESVLVDTLGGKQMALAVNESGIYSLILRSRKPQAKAFKRWLTHEVIPAIRRDGGYISPEATAEQLKALIGTVQEQAETLALTRRELKCLRQALSSTTPLSGYAEISRATGEPRVFFRRSHWRSSKRRTHERSGLGIQLLLALAKPEQAKLNG